MTLTAWIILFSLLGWGFRTAILRLVWSPVAHIPGPKLAALTGLYEMYYELLQKGGGQFCFKIRDLHTQYGPIVRITPHEVHIDDPEFYKTSKLYQRTQGGDKPSHLQDRFGIPNATFSTPDNETHRDRRKAIQGFFSSEHIRLHAENIQEISEDLIDRLEEHRSTGEPVELNRVWGCFTSDIISRLIFDEPRKYVQSSGFKSPFTEATDQLLALGAWSTYFPWIMLLLSIAKWLPTAFVEHLMPLAHTSLQHQRDVEDEVGRAREGRVRADSSRNVLRHLYSTGLQHPKYLRDEAMSLLSAGTETTKWALSVGCFHILHNPEISRKLREELVTLKHKRIREVPLEDLEKLPYLDAIVLESLRLSYGIHERMTRLLDDPLQYKGYTLPPRTPISMDSYTIHMNETVFPGARKFDPDRWLEKPGLRPYLAVFGKGNRDCVGQHLARAMISYGFAALFSQFFLQLHETSEADVTFAWGKTVPRPTRSSKGIRVVLR